MATDNEWLRLLYLKFSGAAVPVAPANSGVNAPFTAPNQGIVYSVVGRSRVSIGIAVTNINTNVGIGLRCSLAPGGTWYPLSVDGSAVLTLTANGNYLYTWEGTAEQIEVKFESESGGTNAQVDVLIRAQ
jgi:hypothetical protein